MSAVRIGRVVNGGRVHIQTPGHNHCPVLAHRNIGIVTSPAKVQPATICRFCARAANIADAHRENTTGQRIDLVIDSLLCRLAPTSTLNPAGYNPAHDAERARIAARWAAFDAQPVAPVEVRHRTWAEIRDDFAAVGRRAADLDALIGASR